VKKKLAKNEIIARKHISSTIARRAFEASRSVFCTVFNSPVFLSSTDPQKEVSLPFSSFQTMGQKRGGPIVWWKFSIWEYIAIDGRTLSNLASRWGGGDEGIGVA
jgi:hypothetical protein